MEMLQDEKMQLLSWSSKQGSILNGAGKLERRSKEGIDYKTQDLPHFHLRNGSTRKQFAEWLSSNQRAFDIVGCWSRPIFAGGWMESSSNDTEAFNLQTPSIFIDMRIPIHRPTHQLKLRKSLKCCSNDDLKLLARQHVFSGYSQPVFDSNNGPLHFIRHHIIDWNYHPNFPRSRPNRWWVSHDAEQQKEIHGETSVATTFKEFSFINDEYGIPVYFERWQRRSNDSKGKKYIAMRRQTGCPVKAKKLGLSIKPDATLVVVGNHFALAVDRPPVNHLPGESGGGGPAHVDYALNVNNRNEAMNYLSLQGSYGNIFCSNSNSNLPSWCIMKSTHPWREGESIFQVNEELDLHWDRQKLSKIIWQGDEWDVLECSFTPRELIGIFPVKNKQIIGLSRL
jgi:hypothetical protein